MDLFELEAFVVLADTCHFARAAARLNMSPSTLSRLLGRLEADAGARLVERDTRRAELTEAGRAYLTWARDTLSRREALARDLAGLDGRLAGQLRVFASVTACYSLLPPFARALAAAHPGLTLAVETGDPADAPLALGESRVDLALAALGPGAFAGERRFSIKRTPLVFVAGREGPHARPWPEPPEPPTPARLAELPLILPRKGPARERLDRWLASHGLAPHLAAEVAGNEAILALAQLGLGVGLVPRLVLDNSPFASGIATCPASPELGDYDIGFVLARRLAPRIAAAVGELLEQAYPDGTWVGDA